LSDSGDTPELDDRQVLPTSVVADHDPMQAFDGAGVSRSEAEAQSGDRLAADRPPEIINKRAVSLLLGRACAAMNE